MTEILISIKPKYVDLILSGRKTVELRRSLGRIAPGARLLLYASSPRRAVVGEARVSFREELPIDEIWARFRSVSGVARDEFDAYYAGTDRGVVLGLVDVRRYPTGLSLRSLRDAHEGFRPPQSYMRVPAFLHGLVCELLGDQARDHEQQDLLPFVAPAQ